MTDKGYVGSVEFSDADGVLFGKVQGVRSLISYEGETREALQAVFRKAIDAYLEPVSYTHLTLPTTSRV